MRLLVAGVMSAALAAGSLTVTRAQQGCDFRVTPTRVELGTEASSGTVLVETQPGCAWSVSGDYWLHPSTAGGSGSGAIGFTADAAIPSATPRQSRLRVRWNTPTAGQDVLVTQSTGSCRAAM